MILEPIRSTVSYLLILIFMSIVAVPMACILLLPRQWRCAKILHYYGGYCVYRVILWCFMLPVRFHGAERMPQEPAIIAVNHQSALDIILVGNLVGVSPHIWLAWEQLFDRFPLGIIVSYIALPIATTSPQRAMRSLMKALDYLHNNPVHAIIFPEGGRFTDGKIHDFYGGFVVLAKKTGRPVVPIYIDRACDAYPPGAYRIRRVPITVTVGNSCMIQDGESDKAFSDRVRAWFIEQQEQRV